jgi:hypothetical protein
MLTFQVSIHSHAHESGRLLSVTFDEALAALERLDRLFIEPDGSFVWTGARAEGGAWQVDGNLIDRGECLAYVELKGDCPEPQFDDLLAAVGWPKARLAFQLQKRGVFLEEAEFRRLAGTSEGAV